MPHGSAFTACIPPGHRDAGGPGKNISCLPIGHPTKLTAVVTLVRYAPVATADSPDSPGFSRTQSQLFSGSLRTEAVLRLHYSPQRRGERREQQGNGLEPNRMIIVSLCVLCTANSSNLCLAQRILRHGNRKERKAREGRKEKTIHRNSRSRRSLRFSFARFAVVVRVWRSGAQFGCGPRPRCVSAVNQSGLGYGGNLGIHSAMCGRGFFEQLL